MTPSSAVVIIGSGLAGYTLAREFRKLDETTPLTIITTDDGSFYSKPMLSNALSKGKRAAQLVTSTAAEMGSKLNATIITHTAVRSINTTAHTVTTADDEITYRALVLACGAIPFRPPMAGDASHEVLSINNLADYARFRECLNDAQQVAVIGPGLIGCEFANDLLENDKAVTIIGPDPHPISALLPAAVGRALQQQLEQQGATWLLETTATAVNRNGSGYTVLLENGTSLNADLVISAVGLRPSTQLAEAAAIEVKRGIVTNKFLETSAGDVYALGDCAEVDGRNLPFVAPLMAGARALAKTLSGDRSSVEYPIMPVVIKTPACPLVVSPPDQAAQGAWQTEGDTPDITARYLNDHNELLGFALSGDAIVHKQVLIKQLQKAQ